MHLTHNEGKSVVAERFIRNLKNKTYKYMTSMSKNVYLDRLDDIVNKHNNAYHRTFKMKAVDVKTTTYINFSSEINDEKLVILLEYQNTKTLLQKAMLQIDLKEFLWLKKLKWLFRGHMLLVILKEKNLNLLERFTKKNCKK